MMLLRNKKYGKDSGRTQRRREPLTESEREARRRKKPHRSGVFSHLMRFTALLAALSQEQLARAGSAKQAPYSARWSPSDCY
jgi:hypothetical protein